MSSETPARQWPVLVKLKHPVDFGGEPIASLEFREGCLGDLKGIKIDTGGITLDQLMLITSRMCGKPIKVIEMLRGKDGAEALAIARDFFTESLTGGDMPSPS